MRRCIDRLAALLFAAPEPVPERQPARPAKLLARARTQLDLLQHENGVLIRALADAQRRTSHCVRGLHGELQDQQGLAMRLRAALVVKETELMFLRDDVAAMLDASHDAAELVICQTGCVSHDHHWLGDDGQCRRTGQACVLNGAPQPAALRQEESS